MRVMLATLCLNEMEWLPKLYEQHKNWPGLVSWVFVEAADKVYAEINPDMVSHMGLSVDGTTDFLRSINIPGHLIHKEFGITSHPDPAKGKIPARQFYLDIADKVQPDIVIALDADEFYTHDAQASICRILEREHTKSNDSFIFKLRNLWRPPSIAHYPLFHAEVVGGYWDMTHCHWWRWKKGMKYGNSHNGPDGYGPPRRFDDHPSNPQCIHMGFASRLRERHAKHQYYVARGEGRTDHRQRYVDCRSAFETWEPGVVLPQGATLLPYYGPIPEVFKDEETRNERRPAQESVQSPDSSQDRG